MVLASPPASAPRLERPVVGTIAREHAGETSFRLEARARLCAMPTTTMRALRAVDQSVAAHADALAHGRPDDLPPVIAAFIDARRAIQTGDGARFAAVLDADVGDDELMEAVPAAFAWTPHLLGTRMLRALVRAEASWVLLGIGLAAHAARGRDPGAALGWALDADDPGVRGAAAECAARAGRVDLAAKLGQLAKGEGKGGTALLGASALLGDARARDALWEESAAAPATRPEHAVGLRLGGDAAEARTLLDVLRSDDARRGDYVDAVAALGDVTHVDGVLEAMNDPATARRAGLAFELLTGIEIRDGLAAEGPSADDDDPLRDRPTPRRDVVAAAWRSRRTRFTSGRRYLLGVEPSEAQCRALVAGDSVPRAHREAAALELMRIAPRAGWIDVDAPRAF